MTFWSLLPLSFVMIAGPQILSSVFLATSERWKANSAAFALGAAISISIIVTAAYLLGNGFSEGGASDEALYIVVIVLLLLAMVRTYLKREESEPPKWMGRLQTASPGFSFKLGFLLLGVFPTDILTSVAVGSYLAVHDDSLAQGIPFVLLTLFLLTLPALLLLVFGRRAQAFLPKMREWMQTNSWVVNEVVLAFFIVIAASDL
jgi:cytochrome c biogenesis protein CcdA